LLGQLCGLNHDSAKSGGAIQLAQGLDANSEEVALNMARLYSEQGDPKRAAEVLNAIPVEDRSPRIEFALGASYEQEEEQRRDQPPYHRARSIWTRTISTPSVGLSNALLADGQLDEALKVLTGIVAAEPQDWQSQIHISRDRAEAGTLRSGAQDAGEGKTLAPDSLELTLQRSAHLRFAHRYDDAITVLTKLVLDTEHADGKYSDGEKSNRSIFLDRLAVIYREENKTAEAVATYKKLVALGSDYVKSGYSGQWMLPAMPTSGKRHRRRC
jgi:tetratricopeptide (TPR) repeat protein